MRGGGGGVVQQEQNTVHRCGAIRKGRDAVMVVLQENKMYRRRVIRAIKRKLTASSVTLGVCRVAYAMRLFQAFICLLRMSHYLRDTLVIGLQEVQPILQQLFKRDAKMVAASLATVMMTVFLVRNGMGSMSRLRRRVYFYTQPPRPVRSYRKRFFFII